MSQSVTYYSLLFFKIYLQMIIIRITVCGRRITHRSIMQIHTLCPVHRKWLILHPEQAMAYIDKLHCAGQKLRQEGATREAIPYLYCAYDVCALMLERQVEQYPQVVTQFTGVALSLADTLRKDGLGIKPGELMVEAYNKLEACCADMELAPFVPHYLEPCLNALKNGREYFGHPMDQVAREPMLVH